MTSRRVPADEVFVVRFWREQDDCEGKFRWRAQVRSVTSRNRYIVDSVEAALALIRTRLDDASPREQSELQDD
ncbi:MAG: hypothetical protein JO230_01815 [Xanthobacteraceae bacterium]|nr:hypothetical protein [Xanthobacteraceae bacterium]